MFTLAKGTRGLDKSETCFNLRDDLNITDINDNPNVSGSGINMAQRCMDAGDNDHILISNGVHQYVNQMEIPGLKFEDWGPVIVKHGSTVHMWTAYGSNFGRTEFPDWRGTKKAEFKTE